MQVEIEKLLESKQKGLRCLSNVRQLSQKTPVDIIEGPIILLNDDIDEEKKTKKKQGKKELVYELKCKPKTKKKESKQKIYNFKKKLIGKQFYSSNKDDEEQEEISLFNSDQDSDDDLFQHLPKKIQKNYTQVKKKKKIEKDNLLYNQCS